MEYDILALLRRLDIKFESVGERRKVTGFKSLERAKADEASFYSGKSNQAAKNVIAQSKASVILCKADMKGLVHPRDNRQQLIFTDNPRLAFIRVCNTILKKKTRVGISSRAVISELARIAPSCYVGDFSVIGDNCQIGERSTIHSRVSLLQNSKVGKDCVIHDGAVIGVDGFSYERDSSLKLEKFPHIGGVYIGDGVEISANAIIEKGALSDTVIGAGTKIDTLVVIGHNSVIGNDCAFTAGAIVGGSVSIGDFCWAGLNSTIKQKVRIGNNVIIAAGACVINDVPDNDIVAGVPATSIKLKVNTERVFMMAGQRLIRNKG